MMGLNYPDVFGNVLCQAANIWVGSKSDFTRAPNEDKDDFLYLIEEYVTRDPVDINIHMDMGRYEGKEGLYGFPTNFWVNRHMRDVLRLKNYKHKYVETNSAHDYLGWRDTLADGLIYLLGNQ